MMEADVGGRMDRRQFLTLTAAALLTGCQTMGDSGSAAVARDERVVNAGPVTNYTTEGLYAGFCNQGFFVVRNGDRLRAISSVCTHRRCKLTAQPDHSFVCPCHGSTFDPNGRVTEGPASRDLPALSTHTNEIGQLLVTIPNPR